MRREIMTGIVAGVAALVLTSVALAGPRDIAEDLKDGKLDGTYTRQELLAFIGDPLVQGYGNPVLVPAPGGNGLPPGGGGEVAGVRTTQETPARDVAGVRTTQTQTPTSSPLGETRTTGALPFTGVDLVLIVVGGVLLLGLGAGARRVAAVRH